MDTTLDYDDEEAFDDFEDDEIDSGDESIDPGFDESAEGENIMIKANFSLEFMKKASNFYDARDSYGRKKHTWKSTQHGFKAVPHRQYITRFRHYIEQHVTTSEKVLIIDDFVYDMFEEARENILPVHDRDLKRWALQKAAEYSSLISETSDHWLQIFKHRHHICFRKIAKLVTRHHAEDTNAISEPADLFVRDAKR